MSESERVCAALCRWRQPKWVLPYYGAAGFVVCVCRRRRRRVQVRASLPEESQATLFAVAPSRLVVGQNVAAAELHNFVPGHAPRRVDDGAAAAVAVAVAGAGAPNSELALVAKRSAWRFFDSGEDLLLTPASAWASNSFKFDDGYWRSGPAPSCREPRHHDVCRSSRA